MFAPMYVLCSFAKKAADVWIYPGVIYSIQLFFVSLLVSTPWCFLLVWLCSIKSGIVIHPAILFLLRIALTNQGLLCVHIYFRLIFLSLWRMSLESWWGLHWTDGLLSAIELSCSIVILQSFYHKWCWILLEAFSSCNFCHNSIYKMYCIFVMCILNQYCIPGRKPTWSWYMIFFDVLLNIF
jgi:hypothetical protein